jgi:CRISPR/Cas system-associated protein Cas10 (large subunit of type III CRISPR-Cas system)
MNITSVPSDRLAEELIKRRNELNSEAAYAEETLRDYGVSLDLLNEGKVEEIVKAMGEDMRLAVEEYVKGTAERIRLNAMNLDGWYSCIHVNIDKKDEIDPAGSV